MPQPYIPKMGKYRSCVIFSTNNNLRVNSSIIIITKMKKYTGIFLTILLLTFGFTINSEEIFASSSMKEKEKTGWGQIKKLELVNLEGTLDMNFDRIPDVYLKLINPDKSNQASQIQIKITGECVNGEIHDDAAMKIGFSTPVRLSTEFFDEEFKVTNKWFKIKNHDANKRIDLVVITSVAEYFSFPTTGDDLIQKNPKDKKGSFEFTTSSIPELGEQSGWEGSFEFKGEPGDYSLVFFFPLTEPTNKGDSCNFVSSFSIPTTINS